MKAYAGGDTSVLSLDGIVSEGRQKKHAKERTDDELTQPQVYTRGLATITPVMATTASDPQPEE